MATSGSLYLDDFQLVEKGPSIDVATAPLSTIVERLAHRQFNALWTARNKTSGLIPNSSDDVQLGAQHNNRRRLESARGHTSRLGHPVGCRCVHGPGGDVTQYESRSNDFSADPIFESGHGGSDRNRGVQHRRFVYLFGAAQLQIATGHFPALHDAIDSLENRFNFAAFAQSGGFNLAYNPAERLHAVHLQRLYQREEGDSPGGRCLG